MKGKEYARKKELICGTLEEIKEFFQETIGWKLKGISQIDSTDAEYQYVLNDGETIEKQLDEISHKNPPVGMITYFKALVDNTQNKGQVSLSVVAQYVFIRPAINIF